LGGRHATRWSDSRDNPRVGRTKGRDVRGEKEEFRALQSNKRNDKVRGSARLKPMLAKPVLSCLALPAWQARPAPTIAVCPRCPVSTSCIRMRAVKINAKHTRHLARLISRHVLYSGCSVSTHSLTRVHSTETEAQKDMVLILRAQLSTKVAQTRHEKRRDPFPHASSCTHTILTRRQRAGSDMACRNENVLACPRVGRSTGTRGREAQRP
jgi:hypothetical protein